MSSTRREFIRRVVAASFLLATGAVAVWEILETGQKAQPPVIGVLPTPSTEQTSVQTSPQQSSTSQQPATSQQTATSQKTSQTTSQTSSQSSSQTSTQQQVPQGYFLVAPLSALNGKTYAYFNHPSGGLSILVLVGGAWKAFNATCTHQPCTVGYSGSQIQCPCHGGTFNPSTGAVTGGPPPTKLPEYGVIAQNNNLYVSQAVVN